MLKLRWSLASLLLGTLAWTTPTSAAPAPAEGEPIEWVQTSNDSVMPAAVYEATQPDGPFKPVFNGEGFNAFGTRNWGDYTLVLATSSEGDIETYRIEAQEAANQINALFGGIHIQVAAGTVTGPSDPMEFDANVGEIRVMIASNSPCGPMPGTTGTAGCGGPGSFGFIDGETRYASGLVWLRPSLPEGSPNIQQAVLLHEIGHALGLDHFPGLYGGQPQLMAPSVGSFDDYRAGDLNGIDWTSGPHPSNDDVTGADRVCLGDSTVSAKTWFATAEAGEAVHAGSAARRSLWYKYTPHADQNGGTATITTVSDGIDDFDTVLHVYSGATPTTSVTSNDDIALLNVRSSVSFSIDSSLTYWIALDGNGGVDPEVWPSRGETDITFDLPAVSEPFVQLCAPARLLDTRTGGSTIDAQHQGVGQIQANTSYTLPIAGRAGVPVDAAAVVLNVTAFLPAGGGFVTVYPCGTVPNASNLNFVANDVIANSVLARLDGSGRACFFASVRTHLIVDVSGHFSGTTALTSLSEPARLMDTRIGGSTIDDQHESVGRINANTPYELPITGRATIPGGTQTVVLNVTAVAPSAPGGFVTVWPCGQPQPNASNLNFQPGETIPNLVLARIGTGGKVCLVSSVATDLLVDASGYFLDTTYLVPLAAPQRVLDTRASGMTVDGQHQAVGPLGGGQVYKLPIAGRAGVHANALTVVVNVTAAGPSSGGYLTIFPCGQNLPNASNLNYAIGDAIPNSVLAGVGTLGQICIYSYADVHLIVDVSGYFL